MVIRNLNFCIFAECAHLDGEECAVQSCPFSPKLINWWEWSQAKRNYIVSTPPSGKYKITEIYRNESGNLEYEYENVPEP